MDDATLLARYSETRSEEALQTLIDRHTAMVYATCLRRLRGNSAEAEEVTQAVFVLLAQRAGKIRNGEQLAGWLHGAARHVVAHLRRENTRRKTREQEAVAMRTARAVLANDRRLELRQELDDALDTLPRQLRDALVLHYLEGRTEMEIAAILGCGERTVRRRLVEGLEKLRRRLAHRPEEWTAATLASWLSVEAVETVPVGLPTACQAGALAAGSSTAGAVCAGSCSAAVLAKGVTQMLFWMKIKVCATVLAASTVVGASGIGLTHWAMAEENAPPAKPNENATATPSKAEEKASETPKKKGLPFGEADHGLAARLAPLGGKAKEESRLIGPDCEICAVSKRLHGPDWGKCRKCKEECEDHFGYFCSSCAAKERKFRCCGKDKPYESSFSNREPMAFEISLQNQNKENLKIADGAWPPAWILNLQPVGDAKKTIQLKDFVKYRRIPSPPIELKPDRTVWFILSTDRWAFLEQPGKLSSADKLPPGRYRVTAEHSRATDPGMKTENWQGQVTTNTVEIEIVTAARKEDAARAEDGSAKDDESALELVRETALTRWPDPLNFPKNPRCSLRDVKRIESPLLAKYFPKVPFFEVVVNHYGMGIESDNRYCAAVREKKVVWAYENRPGKPGCPPLSETADFCAGLIAKTPDEALEVIRVMMELTRFSILEDATQAPKRFPAAKANKISKPAVLEMKDDVSGEDIFRVRVYVNSDPDIGGVEYIEVDVDKNGGIQRNFHGIRRTSLGSARLRL